MPNSTPSMKIKLYLANVQEGVTGLFKYLESDIGAIENIEGQIKQCETLIKSAMPMTEEDNAPYYIALFGAQMAKKEENESTLIRYQTDRQMRRTSVSLWAGSILQAAKQGISEAWGPSYPHGKGRRIKSQYASDVILGGRNHSAHWEESPHLATKQILDKLDTDYPDKAISRYSNPENVALEIVEILGWRKFSDFEADLNNICI